MKLTDASEVISQSQARRCSRYEVFGVVLASNVEFATLLAPADAPPDVVFELVDSPVVDRDNWGPPLRSEPGGFSMHRTGDVDVLLFVDEAVFFLRDERISCWLFDDSRTDIAEIRLFGGVLAYWLESRGIPTLHASAVVIDGRAVVFASGNGGGKTSLAAELMRRGHPLLTDDILPIELRDGVPFGRPGYPQVRMWPGEAERYAGGVSGLSLVHPAFAKLRVPVGDGGIGVFCRDPVELEVVYFVYPIEGEAAAEFEPIPPVESVLRLAAASFAAPVAAVAPRPEERFRTLSQVASQVPVSWLMYGKRRSAPSETADAVLGHLRTKAQRMRTEGA